jgi:hypothetical protein
MSAVKQELQEDVAFRHARSAVHNSNFNYQNAAAAAAARAGGFEEASTSYTRAPVGYIASTEPDCRFFLQFGCSKVRYMGSVVVQCSLVTHLSFLTHSTIPICPTSGL